MKRFRLVLALLVTAVVIGVVVWRAPRKKKETGYAEPADCVSAYGEAWKDGDVAALLKCLGEPLRSQVQQRTVDERRLAESLQRETADLKGWAQHPVQIIDDSAAQIEVELVRVNGNHRLCFHLEKADTGWLIVRIEGPSNLASPIPYGAPVGSVPATQEPPDVR